MDGSTFETAAAGRADFAERAADLLKLISRFRRRLPLIIGVALVVFSAAVIFTFQQTPRYTGYTDIVIDSRKTHVVDLGSVMSGLSNDSAALDTEVQVLRSRSLAERVVRDEALDKDPTFNPPPKPSWLAQIFSGGRPPAAPPNDPISVRLRHEAVVDKALDGLGVSRLGTTYVLRLSYKAETPARAAELANAFAKAYLLQQLDAKFDATRQANEWLNGKVGDLRQQVIDADMAVQQYKLANNLMSAEGATLTEQEVTTLDSQLAAARALQAEADARLSTARSQMASGSTGEDVGEALNSPMIQSLRAQRSATNQKIADLEGRYGERHPDLLKARREQADIDSQIKQGIQTIISNLEAQAQVARQRTASIEGSVNRSRGVLAGNNRASVRLAELQRNADSAKALYESFLNRFKETSAQQGMETSDAHVVSAAQIPGAPSSPNKIRNLIIGLVLALAAGVGAAVLAELLDSGISTAEDLESALDLPYLGGIPSLVSTLDAGQRSEPKIAPVDQVVKAPLSSFSEAFRNLRASVLFSRLGQQVKVVAVTSSLPGEGKTTTSLALARTLSIAGAKTIVVDCDLRQRSVNRILDAEPSIGLLEVLSGSATLEQALRRDVGSGAMILPLAKSAYTPRDVFGTDAMKELLQELRRRYDVVVLDTAPVLPIADTRVLAPLADAVVLLVRWRKTPRKAAESALKMLTSVHAFVVGAALTQVDLRAQSRYGYGDPGYYYQTYRKYYAQ